ncbi:reticulocyte-binding protein 2 homolog a, partial [Elysia marginata]
MPATLQSCSKQVWAKCANPEASLKGFMRSGIYPFDPNRALLSGKMEASRAFSYPPAEQSSTPAQTPLNKPCSSGDATGQTPLPPAEETEAGCSVVPPDGTSNLKWDALGALLDVAADVVRVKCNSFFIAAKENRSIKNDVDFKKFLKNVSDLSLVSPATPPAPVAEPSLFSCRRTLDDVLAVPQLPRNKSGKVQNKNKSLTMVFSSQSYRQFFREKEARVEEAAKAKEARKVDREKAKEMKEKEKKERQERVRLERERNKRERQMAIEKKKQEKVLKDLEKKSKKKSELGDEDGDVEMVLESDN